MPYKLLELFVKKITRGKATLVTVDGSTEFVLPCADLPPEIRPEKKLHLEISESEPDPDAAARQRLEQIIN